MKLLLFTAMLFSTQLFAATVTCETKDVKAIVSYTSQTDLKVTLNGETTLADGIVTKDEVDLVARFRSHGELTIYARVGKSDPGNYLFFKGKRNPVICR